jgi:hypothetical protein
MAPGEGGSGVLATRRSVDVGFEADGAVLVAGIRTGVARGRPVGMGAGIVRPAVGDICGAVATAVRPLVGAGTAVLGGWPVPGVAGAGAGRPGTRGNSTLGSGASATEVDVALESGLAALGLGKRVGGRLGVSRGVADAVGRATAVGNGSAGAAVGIT